MSPGNRTCLDTPLPPLPSPRCVDSLDNPTVCKLCNDTDVRRFYDEDDSSCKDCKEHLVLKMLFTWALLLTAILSALLFNRYGRTAYRRFKHRYARQLTKWRPLKNWLRIVWGGYQILTKVPAIYQLALPSGVSDIIATILPAVEFGLGGVATVPLQFLGLSGYLPQLLFVMLLPPVVFALAYPLVVAPTTPTTSMRSSRASRVAQQVQHGLPLALFISFLAFPIVSTQA